MAPTTVAIHHLLGHACEQLTSAIAMEIKSEYFRKLSADSKTRYECKVTSSGLTKDPYAIDEWTVDPDTVPEVQ